jgi:type IV pilus assembly protein PilW
MNNQVSARIKPRGLTMIEIMVALAIGSFLILGATGLFISNKRVYEEQDAMGRLQENARFAVNALTGDLRMAGYLGCSDDPALVNNMLPDSADDDNLSNFNNIIEGSENSGVWLPTGSPDPVGISDAITVRYLDPIPFDEVAVNGTMANGSTTSNIPLACGTGCSSHFMAQEAVAISDCASTDVFLVTAVNTNDLGHTTAAFSKGYDPSAQISRYVANRYYIAFGSNGPSLFRRTYNQDKEDLDADTDTTEFFIQDQELVEGVENMQVLYGVDNNNDLIADSFQTAANVTGAGGWDNVVSVKFALLLRTVNEDNNYEVDTATYQLLDINFDPVDDRRRRRVYSATVQIRNRS